jgi:hypothetical protein
VEGLVVFGPNHGNRVTFVRTDQWIGPLDEIDGQVALRQVCERYLRAYGPVTHGEFARWFATKPQATRALMDSMDLEEVDVEGWRGWLPRGDAEPPPTASEPSEAQVHLLPQYDIYVVGSFPRQQLIPRIAPAELQRGTAAPFAVVLVDGVIGGLWQRTRRGNCVDICVDTFRPLSKPQTHALERQAQRIGEVMELPVRISFGDVPPRAHL